MKKKILALCLAVTVCLTSTESGVVAYAGQEQKAVEEAVGETEESSQDTENKEEGATGYVELPDDHEVDTLAEEDIEVLKAGLPSSYTTSNLPKIRDQGQFGTCWAHSATALAELSTLQNGTAMNVSDMDFSELHLAYFANHLVADPLGGTTGDSYTYVNTQKNYLDYGGNYLNAMYTYANWVGAADEDLAPYGEAYDTLTNGLDNSLAYVDAAHMKNAYEVNIRENPEAVKTLIQELGGVGISYYSDDDSYYNSEHNCYYDPQGDSTNHGVVVVGWDDNFSKDNFNNTPEGDGAWLVRNSWGEDANSYNGYFWMSYYDNSLEPRAYAFDFVGNDNEEYYDNNYQYDGATFPYYLSTSSDSLTVSNIFTVHGNSELLKAVSFDTGTTSEDYTIQIYINLKNPLNPESGILADTLTGRTTYQGMYSVLLSKSVYLTKNETYAVVVTLSKNGSVPKIGIERSGNVNAISYTASSLSGQSLYKSGTSWVDYGNNGEGNFRIKAYTNNVEGSVAVTGVSVAADTTTLGVGGTTTVTATVAPSNATNQNVTWSSSNTSVATVAQNGVVTGVAAGTAKITATTSDGGYTASCTVKVNKNETKCVAVANSDGSVTISWDALDGVNGYYVYRNGERIKLIKDAATTKYTDTTANAGKTSYYYGVCAYYKGMGSTVYSGYNKSYVRYPINYALKGGTNNSGNPSYFTANSIGTTYTLGNATKKGYTFAGWYSDSSYKNKITSLTAQRKIANVYAKWTENKYTISFQGNGSSGGSMSKMTKLKYSKSYTLTKNAFKKKGYKFTGWNTKADGSGKTYKNKASIAKLTATNGKTVKLYAQWKKVSYTITYKLNGGKNNSKNPAKYNVKTKTIKLKKPTRKGYTFVGWYSDKSCKKKVTQIKKGSTGNKTLYAKWKKK